MDKNTRAVFSLPAVKAASFLLAGLLIEYFLGWGILVLPAIAVIVISLKRYKKAVLPAAAFLAGMMTMGFWVGTYISPVLDYDGQTIRTLMLIQDVAEETQDLQRVTALADINGLKAAVRLTGNFMAESGDVVEADVKYSVPDDRYKAADLSEEIFLYGTAENVAKSSDDRFFVSRIIYMARRNCITRVKNAFSGDEQSVICSMMFGDDGFVSAKMREALCVSGVTHYTAVSGTHFTIFAAILLELFLDRRKKTSSVISVLMIPIGMLFFGYSLSVLRSGIMLAIYYAAPIFNRRSECFNTLCAAASAILLFSPLAILDAGFLMSVLGVFGAAVVAPRICGYLFEMVRGRALRKIVQALTVSFCATVCTAPVSIGVFGGISLAGIFVSAVLIPFMMAGMVLIFLYGLTGMGIIAVAAFPFVKALAVVPMFVGQCRGLWLTMDFRGAVYIAVLSALLLAAAAFIGDDFVALCCRAFAVLTAFSLAMPLYSRANRHEINFACNAGSAAAAVCVENEAYVLISGGGVNIARNAADCLRRNGVTHIRCISAPDADLAGAISIAELAEIFGAERIVTSSFAAGHFETLLPLAEVYVGAGEIDVSGASIASEKINTPCNADVVLYYGRSGKITESGSGTALYFSPSQDELPENGVNIFSDGDFHITLEKYDTITLK